MSNSDPESNYGKEFMDREKRLAHARALDLKEVEIHGREGDKDRAMMLFLLKNELGLRFLGQLLIRDGGLLTLSYVAGAQEGDRQTALREGARGLALQQLDKLTAADALGFVKVQQYVAKEAALLDQERANVT